jgi:hypothetical protein
MSEAELQRLREEHSSLQSRLGDMQDAEIEALRGRAETIVRSVRRRERLEYYMLGAGVAIIITLAGLLTSSSLSAPWVAIGWIVTAFLGFIGFWKVPDCCLESYWRRVGSDGSMGNVSGTASIRMTTGCECI